MRVLPFVIALGFGSLLLAGPPLHVAGVIREGVPPFEGEKQFRIEGEGAANLKPGETLGLWRFNEKRRLARLVVLEVKEGAAFARVLHPEETFPLKGDLVVGRERLVPLPELPFTLMGGFPRAEALGPTPLQSAVPRLNPQAPPRRELINFLKGDARLSPGGAQKLKAWVDGWGLEGQWSLGVPQEKKPSGDLTKRRIEALTVALKAYGVAELKVLTLPEEPEGKYDGIYVVKEP